MSVHLRIDSGSQANTSLCIEAGKPLRVGRTTLSDCILPEDKTLSRAHFELVYDGHACLLRDLNSSNGTSLNGAEIIETPLKDGDQITAGQTRFSIHIQSEPVLPAPYAPMVPPDGLAPDPDFIQNRLLSAMRNSLQPLYAILDASHDPAILKALLDSKCEFCPLFQGELAIQLSPFVPYVVPLPPHSPLLPILLKNGWGKSWGIYLTSNATPADLLTLLRRHLPARLPDGRTSLLRFYDPRVLRVLLPSCTPLQLCHLFGPPTLPIGLYVLEAEEPEAILTFSLKPQGLEKTELSMIPTTQPKTSVIAFKPATPSNQPQPQPEIPTEILHLRPDQMKLLDKSKQEILEKALRKELQEKSPGQIAALSEPELVDLIYHGSTYPQRYGIRAQPDILSYIQLMLHLGRNFDTDPNHPWAKDLLARRIPPAEKLKRIDMKMKIKKTLAEDS